MATKLTRRMIELDKKRIPLRKLLHGKEIRTAAKALEEFRLHFNEQEILLGAKLTIKWENYDTVYLVASRLETDNEFAERMERARIVQEQKLERERKRKEQEAIRARLKEQETKKSALETIRKLAWANNLSDEEIASLLK